MNGSMAGRIRLLVAILGLAGPAAALDRTGRLGVGVIAGSPIGVTAKYWLAAGRAVDVGLGFDGEPSLYADLLYHRAFDPFPEPARGVLGGYFGFGVRTSGGDLFGIRVPLGLSFFPYRHPLEFFLEVAPVFSTRADFDGGFGVRYHFSLGRGRGN